MRDYNPQARRCMDLHYYVKNICDDMAEDLKIKCSNYLCENQNFFLNSESVEDEASKSKEHFLLEIKVGDDVFIQRILRVYVFKWTNRYIRCYIL